MVTQDAPLESVLADMAAQPDVNGLLVLDNLDLCVRSRGILSEADAGTVADLAGRVCKRPGEVVRVPFEKGSLLLHRTDRLTVAVLKGMDANAQDAADA